MLIQCAGRSRWNRGVGRDSTEGGGRLHVLASPEMAPRKGVAGACGIRGLGVVMVETTAQVEQSEVELALMVKRSAD